MQLKRLEFIRGNVLTYQKILLESSSGMLTRIPNEAFEKKKLFRDVARLTRDLTKKIVYRYSRGFFVLRPALREISDK